MRSQKSQGKQFEKTPLYSLFFLSTKCFLKCSAHLCDGTFLQHSAAAGGGDWGVWEACIHLKWSDGEAEWDAGIKIIIPKDCRDCKSPKSPMQIRKMTNCFLQCCLCCLSGWANKHIQSCEAAAEFQWFKLWLSCLIY